MGEYSYQSWALRVSGGEEYIRAGSVIVLVTVLLLGSLDEIYSMDLRRYHVIRGSEIYPRPPGVN